MTTDSKKALLTLFHLEFNKEKKIKSIRVTDIDIGKHIGYVDVVGNIKSNE
ncbi:hypothetical protein Bhyg_13879, partial [Pseudolycoriella hygida]